MRFTFVAAAYHPCTPHASVPLGAGLRAWSRETRESFFEAIALAIFYETVNFRDEWQVNRGKGGSEFSEV